MKTLNAKFKVRFFAFDTTAKRVPNETLTQAEGESTDIPQAFNEALDDLQGIPLSGAVLLTDGVDRSGVDVAKFAMQIRERKLPIHTVGIGAGRGQSRSGTGQGRCTPDRRRGFPCQCMGNAATEAVQGKEGERPIDTQTDAS